MKGKGANLCNYSVPFVNLSGLFGKKSREDEEMKEGELSARSEGMSVPYSSKPHLLSKSQASHSQSMATGIGEGAESRRTPEMMLRSEKEKKEL